MAKERGTIIYAWVPLKYKINSNLLSFHKESALSISGLSDAIKIIKCTYIAMHLVLYLVLYTV